MKYTGITYRPPYEANSLLLQVTTGCSHNRCSFCTMYRDVPFSVESMQQIEHDLSEAREYAPGVKRVFLIFTGTIHADPGCPLYDDMQSGRFVEPTIGEHIEEEELFLQSLDIDNCMYFGLHPSNVVRMQGWLSRDKETMIEEVRKTRNGLRHRLDERPVRYGEGAILL